ncbi:SlyX protein [Rhodobacterales bacterium HKCCE2091]|nr:SlyX protein [Rhodobacterales bacterium HKCCE2091]
MSGGRMARNRAVKSAPCARMQQEMGNSVEFETHIAHLERMVEELSDVVARQDDEIRKLSARVELLMRREAEREAADGGVLPMADVRPPHW